ncbi:ABC transporter permease [Paenibacillus sp. MMS20-IR301]|uniref:ABC transporter permease n=1 Tax=Paenibacillus sp. MMS20-IR301 TaxID=2895946 RepID=UPI0028F0F575|nr:ABC transporter permease [Paenibacillus sp. MMS20-IR301]WNS45444.1 ABC transporter permease [Paenibacillus sp. MMS20-IR301]
MKIRDISRMAWEQVKRRKVVTGLCMTGISIGCAAIIVALSVGQSAQVYVTEQVNQSFKMDEIMVSPGGGIPSNGGKSATASGDANENLDPGKLTKQKLEIIQGLNHVKAASPFQEAGYLQVMTMDNKIGDARVIVADLQMLTAYDHKFKQGGANDQVGSIVLNYGATLGLIDLETRQKLYDKMGSDPFNQDVQDQYRQLSIQPSELYRKQIQIQAQDYSTTTPTTKLSSPLQVSGILAGPKGVDDMQASYDKIIYMSPETAVQLQKELVFDNSTTSVLNLPEEGSYSSVTVKVDDVAYIKQVEQMIQKLSLNASDNLYQQDMLKEQFDMIKMAALGIGVFILIIASISIIVAMTMSTHQRRRQIGIMKVLGANMGQIRNMFITEAALLGLLGGLLGVLFSYLIVMVLNKLVGSAGQGLNFFIPLMNLPVGMSFAIMTGVLSGIYPAISASRTDALTAIKRD